MALAGNAAFATLSPRRTSVGGFRLMTDLVRARVMVMMTAAVLLASVGVLRAGAAAPVTPTTATTRGLLPGGLFTTTTKAPGPPRGILTPPPPPPRPPARTGPLQPTPGPPAAPAAPVPTTTTSTTTTATTFPPDLLAISMSVKRSGPNSTARLLAGLQPLEAFGLTPVQAAIVGMGAFPVAGPADYTDDWLMPRPGLRPHLHQGNDIFAVTGTPVRAPVAGVVGYHNDDPGGYGLYSTVTTSDGTYYLSAHLNAFATGLSSGAGVARGQVIGFVGASGNAIGGTPHDHFELHPRGGGAVNPKSFLDSALAQALAEVPALVKTYQDRVAPPAPAPPEPRAPTAEELQEAPPGPAPAVGPLRPQRLAPAKPSPALIISATSALSFPVTLLPLVLSPLGRKQLARHSRSRRQRRPRRAP